MSIDLEGRDLAHEYPSLGSGDAPTRFDPAQLVWDILRARRRLGRRLNIGRLAAALTEKHLRPVTPTFVKRMLRGPTRDRSVLRPPTLLAAVRRLERLQSSREWRVYKRSDGWYAPKVSRRTQELLFAVRRLSDTSASMGHDWAVSLRPRITALLPARRTRRRAR